MILSNLNIDNDVSPVAFWPTINSKVPGTFLEPTWGTLGLSGVHLVYSRKLKLMTERNVNRPVSLIRQHCFHSLVLSTDPIAVECGGI